MTWMDSCNCKDLFVTDVWSKQEIQYEIDVNSDVWKLVLREFQVSFFFDQYKLCHVNFGNSGCTTGVKISITYTRSPPLTCCCFWCLHNTHRIDRQLLPAAETGAKPIMRTDFSHNYLRLERRRRAHFDAASVGNDLDAFQPVKRHKSPCESWAVIDGDTRQDTCPTSRSLQLAQISSAIYCSCFSLSGNPHLDEILQRQKTNTAGRLLMWQFGLENVKQFLFFQHSLALRRKI